MAQPIGDVADVAKRGRLMGFEDVRVQLGHFAAAHGVQEIGEVTFGPALKGTDQLAVQIEQ